MRSSHSFHLFSSLALWRRSVSSSDRPNAVFIWAVSAVFLLLSGCGRPHQPVDKPVLAVSIEPLRYFVEQIAGDRYRVVSVVPVGFSPETYEPAPEQLLAVSEAIPIFCWLTPPIAWMLPLAMPTHSFLTLTHGLPVAMQSKSAAVCALPCAD